MFITIMGDNLHGSDFFCGLWGVRSCSPELCGSAGFRSSLLSAPEFSSSLGCVSLTQKSQNQPPEYRKHNPEPTTS